MRRSSSNLRSLDVIFSDEAQHDLDHDSEYLLHEAGFDVASRYILAVNKTTNLIAAFPGIGMRCPFDHPPLSQLRRIPLYGRFSQHILFYHLIEDHIEVVRILHGKENWLTLLR